jgi:glycerol dehydrogenase
MLTVFCSPLRYVQGPGAMARLGAEMRAVGLEGPCLIVAGSTAVARLAPTWATALDEAGFVSRVRLFGGESSRREIAAIVQEARGLGGRTIIGAGGGKVLDAARSAAAELGLPFVSCPTVCSTDAPTSALSVIYYDSGPDHGAVEAYQIHRRSPDLVLVDTQVIAESPPRLLASGIGDAMSTWYEARATAAADKPNMRGGRAALAAVSLARLCRDTVLADGEAALAACREGRSTPALERIVEAATLLSGLGFESAGLAAAHAVHNGLTAVPETHGMWHGEKVAFGTLVHILLEADAAGTPQLREETVAEARRVATFFVRIGLPVTLRQLGVPEDGRGPASAAVRRIAERATVAGETIHNMPFPVDADRVAAAIVAADALGGAALAAGPRAD